MWNENFRAWLRARMAEKRIRSGSELASALGVSRTAVARWRQGIERPSVFSCARLAALFERPLEEVLEAAGYDLAELTAIRS